MPAVFESCIEGLRNVRDEAAPLACEQQVRVKAHDDGSSINMKIKDAGYFLPFAVDVRS